jgi:hypothetical protein
VSFLHPAFETEREGILMFDFQRWRLWLKAKAAALEAEGLKVRFAARPDDGPKPAMILEVLGQQAYGGFENWITGETDYTIAILEPKSPRMVSHEWGLLVTDETFEATFTSFITKFRQFELSDRA